MLLDNELAQLRTRLVVSRTVPAAAAAALIAYGASIAGYSKISLWIAILTFLFSPLAFHPFWKYTVRTYRQWSDRSDQITAEIARLRGRVTAIFDKYPGREKGERFKTVYDLAGKALPDLEEALSVGMFRERSEIFVTAFMRNSLAVRVTASIGSPYRCSAADNPSRWKYHVDSLGCDEIPIRAHG